MLMMWSIKSPKTTSIPPMMICTSLLCSLSRSLNWPARPPITTTNMMVKPRTKSREWAKIFQRADDALTSGAGLGDAALAVPVPVDGARRAGSAATATPPPSRDAVEEAAVDDCPLLRDTGRVPVGDASPLLRVTEVEADAGASPLRSGAPVGPPAGIGLERRAAAEVEAAAMTAGPLR